MKKPEIRRERVKTLLDTRFIRVFDLQYGENGHYYDATRREADNLAAVKTEAEFREMLPDAVSCFLIVKTPDTPHRLVLFHEYRYPAGRFLLSPPAGLIDAEDRGGSFEDALLNTARREIFEETGIRLTEKDRLFVVNPLLFSSPGMTDESNGLVCAVAERESLDCLSQRGAVGRECFDGFTLLTREEALSTLRRGRDERGRTYSIFTWAALTYFACGLWQECGSVNGAET